MSFQPPCAAVLAVGTEVTDGQIIDRNSAWISQRLVRAGLRVLEHRAVADDRDEIERAVGELAARADYLFVTGGLGPTSDDFTRDLIAKVFARPLEFHEPSWRHLSAQLTSRGIAVHEIQRQQCYFPRGARVLTNPAGTANAFAFESEWGTETPSRSVRVYVLPGPPTEIAAVWDMNLKNEFENLVPAVEREELLILRCLGRGESQIAEITEEAIRGSALRVGYRAHVPYVEVKLWSKVGAREQVAAAIRAVESGLKDWIVNRNDEDIADSILDWLTARRRGLRVVDFATGGLLHERLTSRWRERTQKLPQKLTQRQLPFSIETRFGGRPPAPVPSAPDEVLAVLEAREDEGKWSLAVKSGDGRETLLESSPPYNYKVFSERGRKYITEKALFDLADVLCRV